MPHEAHPVCSHSGTGELNHNQSSFAGSRVFLNLHFNIHLVILRLGSFDRIAEYGVIHEMQEQPPPSDSIVGSALAVSSTKKAPLRTGGGRSRGTRWEKVKAPCAWLRYAGYGHAHHPDHGLRMRIFISSWKNPLCAETMSKLSAAPGLC